MEKDVDCNIILGCIFRKCDYIRPTTLFPTLLYTSSHFSTTHLLYTISTPTLAPCIQLVSSI